METMIKQLAKNTGLDLTVIDIGNQLKGQWRQHHSGGCSIITKGTDCECHLCLIDKLVYIRRK